MLAPESILFDVGERISDVINLLGLVIIAWGVIKATKEWLFDEWEMVVEHKHNPKKLMHVRRNLAIYLLLGLEFIVASDIIDTMLHLDMHKLILLGGLILIRVVVGYTLDKEIREYEEMKRLKELREREENEVEKKGDILRA